MGTYTADELAKREGVSVSTIRRWLKNESQIQKRAWRVVKVKNRKNGKMTDHIITDVKSGSVTPAYKSKPQMGAEKQLAASNDDPKPPIVEAASLPVTVRPPSPAIQPGFSSVKREARLDSSSPSSGGRSSKLTGDVEFEQLLYQKCLGKSPQVAAATRYNYRKEYSKTGAIPAALRISEGRKYSGGKRAISNEVERRFVQMVQDSAETDQTDERNLPKRLRQVKLFQHRLKKEFPEAHIPASSLYRIVKTRYLKQFLMKPDYEDAHNQRSGYYFTPREPMELVTMDGMIFKYFQIKDAEGQWRSPVVIAAFDVGTRMILAADIYFSESSANCVDFFVQFLRMQSGFPKQTISLRPDRAKGFLNLKRAIHTMNKKYSLVAGDFLFDDDFARALSPKDKVHQEVMHNALHNFEATIMANLPTDRLSGVEKKTKYFSGKPEFVGVRQFDMPLAEFRASAGLNDFLLKHNNSKHNFSSKGKREIWTPQNKFDEFMAADPNPVRFDNADLMEFYKYGYDKVKATVRADGKITYRKRLYQLVDSKSPSLLGIKKSHQIKVSEYKNRLFIFEDRADGVMIGEAQKTKDYREDKDKDKAVHAKKQRRLAESEFDLLANFLGDKMAMTVDSGMLVQLYNSGLTIKVAMDICQQNKPKYDQYQGFIKFNLFKSDFTRHQNSLKPGVKPYAAVL